MDSEDALPYEGDLQAALEKGNDKAVEEIMTWRDNDMLSFSLPRIDETRKICEVEIIFLNDLGMLETNLCGKVDKLNENLNKSNKYFALNIPLKKLLENHYILEDDDRLITKSKKLIGLPICKDVYSLVEKEDYDENFSNVYYSLYTRLHWKLKNSSSDISYVNFQKLPEREMIEQIQDLLKFHIRETRALVEEIEYEIDNPEELEQILYVPEEAL